MKVPSFTSLELLLYIKKIFIFMKHKYQVSRLFSLLLWTVCYLFLNHFSELHISVNICVQILLGVPLEMVHRWWRILIIYLAGVASGSLLTSIVDPEVYLAGASGGVYALLAAHIATIIIVSGLHSRCLHKKKPSSGYIEICTIIWEKLIFLVP